MNAVFAMLVLFSSVLPLGATPASLPQPLTPTSFTDVALERGFWTFWLDLNGNRILQQNLTFCKSEGKLDNFLVAAGKQTGKHRGAVWEDSDVYKVIEGAAYCFAHKRDAELEKQIDNIIDSIAAAQQADGYINTYFTLEEPDKRWTDDSKHETYCAGHLIEAGIAYYQVTGKRALLDVAIRMADHMFATFGPGKRTDVPQHEEVELALIRLWRLTNDQRYLELAQLFVDRRGYTEGRQDGTTSWGETCQDHAPVREQSEAVGHAVRAMYLYSAMTDLAAISGDSGYMGALDRIWRDITGRKMYITGGIGDSSRKNEGFSLPYYLPNATAYCETCASIGMALWNQRMALLYRDAKYADIVERELYNGTLASVSMQGNAFFYCNRLQSNEQRPSWQKCACCPTNMVRFLPTVAGYQYAHDDRNIYVNQYMGSIAKINEVAEGLTLTQSTQYPWDGQIKIQIDVPSPARFALHLRIPQWCEGKQSETDLYHMPDKPEQGTVQAQLNNEVVTPLVIKNGYAVFDRVWNTGDEISIAIPMPVQRVYANDKVEADRGRVALQRGPLVYCMESMDNGRYVPYLAIPPENRFLTDYDPKLLGGIVTVSGKAKMQTTGEEKTQDIDFKAIPYYAWNNRLPGHMQVWFPEKTELAGAYPRPTIASESIPSSSVRNEDRATAINDQIEPANSKDTDVPRMTWWDHRGTAEWVQYNFDKSYQVSGVEIYWFDDTGTGQCRVPQHWRVLYLRNNEWLPVETIGEYGVNTDTFNRVMFNSVTTQGLRIEVQLQPEFSGGILEWRVLE